MSGRDAARPQQFEQVQVWKSNCDLDELIRADQVWLLKRYNHDADETETVQLSELDAARWLLGHSHPLPKEDTWDGAEADVLHHGLGLWLLVREFRPHPACERWEPACERWEIDVKHLTEPEAFAWLVQNNYHSQQRPADAGPKQEPSATKRKRRGGRKPLKDSDQRRWNLYGIICDEHKPGERHVDTLKRLKDRRQVVDLAKEAGVPLSGKTIRAALEWKRITDKRAQGTKKPPRG